MSKTFANRYAPKPMKELPKSVVQALATGQVRVKSISLNDLRRLISAGLMVRITKETRS